MERFGTTAAKAERTLVEALRDRARLSGHGEITADTMLREVCNVWFGDFKRQNKASSTIDAYDDALRLHVLPSVGGLRVRELSGVMGLAVRYEAIDRNPVREVSPITIERKEARSLQLDEVRTLRAGLRRDERAVDRDIPALVDFMLGTGMRIGEVLAVTWDALDLEAGTVEIRATVVRSKVPGSRFSPSPRATPGGGSSTFLRGSYSS